MNPTMNRSAAWLLQVAVVLVGMVVLGFLLWEPHLEGRNANATLFEIYFKDPFLAYVYVGSIPFFVAIHKAFGMFGHAGRKGAFSQASVDALRTIKRCALGVIGFVAGAVVIIILTADREDRPAGIFMSLLVTLGSSGIAIVSALAARSLQRALRRGEGSLPKIEAT